MLPLLRKVLLLLLGKVLPLLPMRCYYCWGRYYCMVGIVVKLDETCGWEGGGYYSAAAD